MKVLYDSQAFAQYKRGGVAKYFATLAQGSPSGSFAAEFDFWACYNSHYFEMGGHRLLHVPPVRGGQRIAKFVNTLVPRRRPRCDVWHATNYDAACLDGRYGAIPMICTVHDMIPELLPEYFASNPHSGKKAYVNQATVIIAVSSQTKSDLVELYGIEPAKIHVVHHGIDLNHQHVTPLPVPDRYVLYVGSRREYKNFDNALRAFHTAARADPSLSLVCTPGGALSESQRAALDPDIAQRIHFVSSTDSQLAYLYSKALMFLYPSLYEGFGIPILEAMINLCPVVLADASCFPEVAADAALYFDPNSHVEMAEAIQRVAADAGLRHSMVERGRTRVRDFSIEAMLEATSTVYRLAADGAGGASQA
ncbi:Glycosyltransferase involved in cell wall bisynthesis [Kaistia soli DSM 19436]|uniref:Glycosyltransferase involved in cell wall bisynthesis n=1 Tax=Kaistia soli DSM 19436 TaxID=1122133 RepID=A0A1M5NEI8_9HYPH|nr:glycosyltransferase family 1 protein [Kaistia soli]SHG87994.1 Glycosyltransferase involved in cell wall bisynthesis [Kaistia soli DSM 19436]